MTPATREIRDITIRTHLQPGDIGTIVWLHGIIYAQEQGWDHGFEAYVAAPLAEFAKSVSRRQCLWIAEKDEQIVGAVAVVEVSDLEAQLRWLLVHPKARGYGLGMKLVQNVVNFASEHGYKNLFLWTVNGLESAARIYRACGFQRTIQKPAATNWGKEVIEERYDLTL